MRIPHSSLKILPVLIALSLQINQSCTSQNNCPKNSFCNQNNYCQCQQGWALDCSIPSTILSQNLQSFNITEAPLYFTIVPSNTEDIFVYRFQMCTDDNMLINLTLYADEGRQNQFDNASKIGQLYRLQTLSRCWILFSPYMYFDSQPNGKIQQMILQLQVDRSSSNALQFINWINKSINGNVEQTNIFKIRVNQILFMSRRGLYIILIIFISIIALTLLLGIVFCIYSVKTRKNRFLDNNISHFKQLLPKYKLKSHHEQISFTCSICLLDFQIGSQVRKTPCTHVFHYDCLDVWCKKHLTCPVCRSSLQKDYLLEQNKRNQMDVLLTSCSNEINRVNFSEIENVLEEDRNGENLRQPLKQTV